MNLNLLGEGFVRCLKYLENEVSLEWWLRELWVGILHHSLLLNSEIQQLVNHKGRSVCYLEDEG